MFYYVSYNYSEAGMGHPLPDGWWVWGNLRPVVGDGYGWWGVLPIVGVGMGRSYPMGMYPLPSLAKLYKKKKVLNIN
jgi:hypothetical protein